MAGEVPGSPIFVMKLSRRSRHLEVQLLADEYGEAIALNGRDCSIQRRHQKILEEGPPVVAPLDVWRDMERAAVSLAKAVSYVNAGTVEYLYQEETMDFFFLELNPRLQVEHPVTEMITQVNLPAAQLQVAMGIPLYMIPDIRALYGLEPLGKTPIDFERTFPKPPSAHCIAVRITAENPDQGFKPTSGSIQELNFRSTKDVWGYFSVDSSGLVHEYADSQFGHLFACGADRQAARENMILALKELSIRGDISTTVEYIRNMLLSEEFQRNCIHTGWLDERIKLTSLGKGLEQSKIEPYLAVACAAAISAQNAYTKRRTSFCELLEKGQSPHRSLLNCREKIVLIHDDVKYSLDCSQACPKTISIACNGSHVDVDIRSLADGGFLIGLGGRHQVVYASNTALEMRLNINGTSVSFPQEYDPTRLISDVAGKLVHCLVNDGDHLSGGEPYAEIEAMKMVMPLKVKEPGTVKWVLSEGATLKTGDMLATLTLDDQSSFTQPEPFSGHLCVPETDGNNGSNKHQLKPHVLLRNAVNHLSMILNGYVVSPSHRKKALNDFFAVGRNPLVPLLEFDEAVSVLSGRIDPKLLTVLMNTANVYRAQCERVSPIGDDTAECSTSVEFPCSDILTAIEKHRLSLPERESAAFQLLTSSLRTIVEQHSPTNGGRIMSAILSLLEEYLSVEREFAGAHSIDEILGNLKKRHDSMKVYGICLSHSSLGSKNALLLDLLDYVESVRAAANTKYSMVDCGSPVEAHDCDWILAFHPVLTEIGGMLNIEYSSVSAVARSLLVEHLISCNSSDCVTLKNAQGGISVSKDRRIFKEAIKHVHEGVTTDTQCSSIEKYFSLKDTVLDFIRESGVDNRVVAQAYIHTVYNKYYPIKYLSSHDGDSEVLGSFMFLEKNVDPFTLPKDHEWQGGEDSCRTLPQVSPYDNAERCSLFELTSPSSSQVEDAFKSSPHELAYSDVDTSSFKNVPPPIPFLSTTGPMNCSDVWGPQGEHVSSGHHCGAIGFSKNTNSIKTVVLDLLKKLPQHSNSKNTKPLNMLHIMVLEGPALDEGVNPVEACSRTIGIELHALDKALQQGGVMFVSCLVWPSPGTTSAASIFTYRHHNEYRVDDVAYRHMELTEAYNLELPRLKNFKIHLEHASHVTGGKIYVYSGIPKNTTRNPPPSMVLMPPNEPKLLEEEFAVRYFARVVSNAAARMQYAFVEMMFVEALGRIDWIMSRPLESLWTEGGTTNKGSANSMHRCDFGNHIFINVTAREPEILPHHMVDLMRETMTRNQDKVIRLGVSHFELRIVCRLNVNSQELVPMRFVATNPTGYVVKVDTYKEVQESQKLVYCSVLSLWDERGTEWAEWHGMCVNDPYPISRPFSHRRSAARMLSNTLYCYDFLKLLEHCIIESWKEFISDRAQSYASIPSPNAVMQAVELVVCSNQNEKGFQGNSCPSPHTTRSSSSVEGLRLVPSRRSPGQNEVGVVVWLVTMRTPEYPHGRQIVLIANDITFKSGSFGTSESAMFALATEYARKKGIPRIFLAANSGARIGMAESLKRRFKVAWTNEEDPTLGYDYLYLDDEDYEEFCSRGAVKGKRVEGENGETRWQICDIVGEEPDLGVENLMGSGRIAGATARAYDDIFTLTVVVGRSVGIGAYLVRLGQRVIQNNMGSPIILTGYRALNTLMGNDVYISNEQLGGGGVMYPNGVTHILCPNILDMMKSALKWLSYVPSTKHACIPKVDITGLDVIERPIGFSPSPGQLYNPRSLIAGITDEVDGGWISGLFDKNSFTETLAGWGKTVVTGRARLGGIPVGIVAAETRPVEKRTPADPADVSSRETLQQQAGSVWFPDSSAKTAQAIRDMGREGLPLMILANWRGFSGGQRDMFDEVLKYGSGIVDALVEYKQPVMVYIPPYAEVRGGAWVVIDACINPTVMEMYAASEGSRGGILEAAGTASIKFRRKDIISCAHRLDSCLVEIDKQLLNVSTNHCQPDIPNDASRDEWEHEMRELMDQREQKLLGVYHQVATHFADLHDTPWRMKTMGAIRSVVPWTEVRMHAFINLILHVV